MKIRGLLAPTLLACASLLANAAAEVSPPNTPASASSGEQIRFQVTAVEEVRGERRVVSDAAVEGPPGTDFDVNLRDGRFQMSARFLTDLAPGGGLNVRAKLDTRRLYGHSEAGLPLYEEDAQRHTLNLNFDEAVVLLPFGGGGDAGRLSIEIKPERVASVGSNAPQITINRPSPGGTISVEATKVPHNFIVEAALLEDGREVARGAADYLLEEPGELLMLPVGAMGEGAKAVLNLTVERFEPGAGEGRAAVRFDLLGGDAVRTTLARNWAGVSSLGSEMVYDVSQTYRGVQGRKYELRLRVNLAPASSFGR